MDMVEKVARAIHGQSLVAGPWESLGSGERTVYEVVSRAAIAAMLEPTEEMIAATAPAHEGEAIVAKVMWRAMISAALTSPAPRRASE